MNRNAPINQYTHTHTHTHTHTRITRTKTWTSTWMNQRLICLLPTLLSSWYVSYRCQPRNLLPKHKVERTRYMKSDRVSRDHDEAHDDERTEWRSTAHCRLVDFGFCGQGTARTQSPTTKNYAPELSTFGIIARVSPTEVQWKGLALEKPPWGSGLSLCQVSMLFRPSLRQLIAPTSFFLTAASHSHFFLASSWIRFQSVFHWHVPIDLTQYYNVQIK